MDKENSMAGDALWANDYLSTARDPSSLDPSVLSATFTEFCCSTGINAVFDVGISNALLAQGLRRNGLRCVEIDIHDLLDVDFVSENTILGDPQMLSRSRAAAERLGAEPFLVSCLNIAEHVDIAHLADFIYNLVSLIDRFGIISISTRPSSRANLYHASILPIDTWKYILDLAGLEVTTFAPLQAFRSQQRFRSDSQELLAVSHWQRRNIFRDDPSHHHYLLLKKHGEIVIDRNEFRARLDQALDVGYRRAKCVLTADIELPLLVYHVSFVQDWSFLRSMLDLWPAERVRVLIRSDLIVPAYRELIESFLRRQGILFATGDTIAEAEQALDHWKLSQGAIFVTATEGLPTFVHGLGALVAIAARRRELTTVCLQHGHELPSSLVMGSQFFGTVDTRAAKQAEAILGGEATCRPVALGSLKHLDTAMAGSDPDALAFRIGSHTRHFRKRVLIGTNLHWTAHGDQADDIFSWLRAALLRYPDIFFLLRPHPDDYATFAVAQDLPSDNLAVVDEATLMCIDWPVSRLLLNVDAVLSTQSTLVEDALVARRPTGILSGKLQSARLRPAEVDWLARGAVQLGAEELAAGAIPESLLTHPAGLGPDCSSESINVKFFDDLCDLTKIPDQKKLIQGAERLAERSFLTNCRYLNLDSHPNGNRQLVSTYLRRFVCEG